MMSKYLDWVAIELLSIPLYAIYVFLVIKSFNEKRRADEKKIQIETYAIKIQEIEEERTLVLR